MRILITSAALPFPQELAASLSRSHQVRLTDRTELASDLEFIRSDLSHDPSVNDLVTGIDAIVHTGEVDPEASASEQLDFQMRCTYNLLQAAVQEGVPRFVYLSSLRIMDKYPEDLTVTERWRPMPSTDPTVLCYHLGEYVCREFGREGKIDLMCLRLGELTREVGPGAVPSSSALFMADALLAVERALTADLSGWNIFHIQSDVPNARYLLSNAQETLGYEPTPRS